MIFLDRNVLAELVELNQDVIDQLKQYCGEEWPVPSIVAGGVVQSTGLPQGDAAGTATLTFRFDRILDFSDDPALEAAHLQDGLRSQGAALDAIDLPDLATAHDAGGTFVTQNKSEFDKTLINDLEDADVVLTE